MLTAEAHVETELASRHLVQFCRHASHMFERPPDRKPEHRGPGRHGAGHRPAGMASLEWSDTYAVLNFGWGRCTLQASPATLDLRVEASDEEGLRRIQEGVGGRLETIGSRDDLRLTWGPPIVLASVRGAGAQGAGARRGPLGTLLLVAVGAAAVALHLGGGLFAGAAAVAALRWARLGADIVVALVLLKVALMAVNLLVLRRLGRQSLDRLPPPAARFLRWVLG